MTTLDKNQVIEYLIENNFNFQDKICVFCSTTYDRWNAVCVSCREYKGMTNIVEAVEYYGIDILPNQGEGVINLTPTKRGSNLTFTLKNEIIELLESILERIT